MTDAKPADSAAETAGAFDRLPLPDTGPRGLLRHFGPGLILMMTGIGTSHLVTAPAAGGRFGYALLWCIPVAYIFKYYGFEMAFRFTNATGRSMLDAYTTAPGKWPVWYVLITTVIQCALGQAGRLAAAAAVLFYVFSEYLDLGLPSWAYGLGLGALSVGIILYGRYAAVEIATKILAGLLFVSTVGVYLFEPAPLGAMGRFFMIETPEGSWLIIAAFLGLLPTGIDVSLQASEWGKAKRVGMGRIREQLERDGLARRFDAFGSRSTDLAVDVSKLPGARAGVLPALVPHRPVGLHAGARRLVRPGRHLPAAGRRLALPERGGRQRGDRRDRAHLHRQHRPRHDADLPAGRVRRHLLDGVQLLRRLAARGGGLLPQPVPFDRRTAGHRRRPAHGRRTGARSCRNTTSTA